MTDFSNILYSPIDIPTPEIDSIKLNNLFEKNCLLHYTKLWNFYTIKAENIKINNTPEGFRKNWLNRYNPEIITEWDNDFEEYFPEMISFLNLLPFKKLTHINILKQLKDIPPHIDYDKDEQTKYDNLCYKWLAVPGDHDSFFIEKEERLFVNPPNNFKCFVIQETKAKHGAIKRNNNKLILSIFGIIDLEKHKSLIKRSLERFDDYVIR